MKEGFKLTDNLKSIWVNKILNCIKGVSTFQAHPRKQKDVEGNVSCPPKQMGVEHCCSKGECTAECLCKIGGGGKEQSK